MALAEQLEITGDWFRPGRPDAKEKFLPDKIQKVEGREPIVQEVKVAEPEIVEPVKMEMGRDTLISPVKNPHKDNRESMSNPYNKENTDPYKNRSNPYDRTTPSVEDIGGR